MIRIFLTHKTEYMFSFIRRLFGGRCNTTNSKEEESTMKYLIVGLGNIGSEYDGTRHNVGFKILDSFANHNNCTFEDKRYGFISKCRVKNAELFLLKPSTYMNLSGNAVRYWLQKEKITIDRMMVICDDISLPLGKIRIRPNGSDGGHNGLKHIGSTLGSQQFTRMRFGVGNEFPRGGQVDYVLGKFSDDDISAISASIDHAESAIKTFCLNGVTMAMNIYNKN